MNIFIKRFSSTGHFSVRVMGDSPVPIGRQVPLARENYLEAAS